MRIPLPYRVRHWLNQRRLAAALRGLDGTQPVPAASPDQASAEVFMLVCKRDLRIAVLALKSLLRFSDGQLAVTVTNDGSLTEADQAWIQKHVPSHRWLNWHDPSLAESDALKDRPMLNKLYFSQYAPVAKLVHPFAHRRVDRALVLDPDTAFFLKPERLEAWWTGRDPRPVYMHDLQDETKDTVVPPAANEAFERLHAHLKQQDATIGEWGVHCRLFNSGLLAFDVNQVSLEIAEVYLQWRSETELDTAGQMNIWFGQWTPEQSCYHVMFACAEPSPEPLGEDYWLGGASGHVFNHFLQHYLAREATHQQLATLIMKLD